MRRLDIMLSGPKVTEQYYFDFLLFKCLRTRPAIPAIPVPSSSKVAGSGNTIALSACPAFALTVTAVAVRITAIIEEILKIKDELIIGFIMIPTPSLFEDLNTS